MADSRVVVVAKDAAMAGGSIPSGLKAKAVDSSGKSKATAADSSSQPSAGGEAVVDMMRRLNLTSKEATPLILDDEGDDDLPCPEWALIGRVLAPNTLHVNTITAVVRPAWGNPKGLIVRPMGPNLFLAEFGSEADKSSVANGGPWYLAAASQEIQIESRRSSSEWRAMTSSWGSYLRARVVIDPTQPIMRCVSAYSMKKDTTFFFDVMYERLPTFCFSSGLLGHSSLVCPMPADRDAEGKLPYHGEKLCVPERKKKDVVASNDQSQSNRNFHTGDEGGSGPHAHGRTTKAGGQGEVTSPPKKNSRARKPAVPRKEATVKGNGKDVVTVDNDRVTGQKRKQIKVYRVKNPDTVPVCSEGAGALVLVEPCDPATVLDAVHAKVSDEMNEDLLKPYLDEEIKAALFQMGPTKSPGPDGFPALFYQSHWNILKDDICSTVRGFLLGEEIPPGFCDSINHR
ncbi:hypothetical protein ACQ4PT_065235 [Festuca glaucescens]